MKGSKEFFVDCLGHAIEHLQLCVWDDEEDIWTQLGHAATNIAFILWALARGKVSRRDFQRAAMVAQDEKMEILRAQEATMRAQLRTESGMLSMKSSSGPSLTTTAGSYGSFTSR